MSKLPAWLKLIALTVTVSFVMWQQSLSVLAGAGVLVLLMFVLARPGLRPIWLQLRPVLVVSGVALLVNVLLLPIHDALLTSGRIAVALSLAALYSLTTSATESLNVVMQLLSPVIGRERAERFGLLVSLTIRSLPILSTILRDVQDARRARGLERSVRALVVPVLVRAITSADELGEALAARGAVE